MRTTLIVFTALLALGAAAQQPAQPDSALRDPSVTKALEAFLKEWPGTWKITPDVTGKIAVISGGPSPSKALSKFETPETFQELAGLGGSPVPKIGEAEVRRIGDLVQTTAWQVLEGQRVEGATITITRSLSRNLYDVVLNQVKDIPPPPAIRSPESAKRVARLAYLTDLAEEAATAKRPTVLEAELLAGNCPILEAEPSQPLEDGLQGFFGIALQIRVVDPQYHGAAIAPGV